MSLGSLDLSVANNESLWMKFSDGKIKVPDDYWSLEDVQKTIPAAQFKREVLYDALNDVASNFTKLADSDLQMIYNKLFKIATPMNVDENSSEDEAPSSPPKSNRRRASGKNAEPDSEEEEEEEDYASSDDSADGRSVPKNDDEDDEDDEDEDDDDDDG